VKTYTLPFFFLVFAAAFALSCGSSSGPRLLQTVTVSPASADAQDFPEGTVQFTATGFFNTHPSPVSPLTTFWGACFQGGTTTDIAVDTHAGTAQCLSTAHGTYTIYTENYSTMDDSSGGSCLATSACGGGCFITGTARLTCP